MLPKRLSLSKAARHGETVLYRVAGLPVALAALFRPEGGDALSAMRAAYARQYWAPENWGEIADIAAALALSPVVFALSALWFTARNGRRIARRCGRPIWRQLGDQLTCYASAGILPPWYYIFSLHDVDAAAQAGTFLNRYETKRGLYRLLTANRPSLSPLADKAAFARWCADRALPTAATIGTARNGRYDGARLPPADLFVKPIVGRGGRGAERWDYIGNRRYKHERHGVLSEAQLRDRLAVRSIATPRLVQLRLVNHPALQRFSNGALATVRVLTCLDERGEPEIAAAVFRMAVGNNRTVDNIHAGGIATGIDLASGRLGQASDIGMAASGWLDRHPDTGAAIAGTILPGWRAVRDLALRAHAAFADRVCIGWDIALTDAGPCLIEGNGAPDVDLMQRPMRRGLATERFGILLAHHVRAAERGRRAAPLPHRRSRRATT